MAIIFSPNGITIEQHEKFFSSYICSNCGKNRLRPLVFNYDVHTSGFCYECIECYTNNIFVYSKHQFSTLDIIVNIVNTLNPIKIQLQKESSKGICNKCNQGNLKSIRNISSSRMAIDILEFNKCKFSVPVLSIVRDTLCAYSYNIRRAKDLSNSFPEIALVFCISSIEVYFRQLIKYQSKLCEYLTEKTSFQNPKEIKKNHVFSI